MLGGTGRFSMQTRSFPSTPDGRSPAGAKIRHLIEGESGGMIHSIVPPGQVNRATVHATVSEFWHVLSGEGQIWRRDATGEDIGGGGIYSHGRSVALMDSILSGNTPNDCKGW